MNYKKFYAIYKKLPVISSIGCLLLFFVWSILDVFVIGYPFGYGMMHQDTIFFALIIWWVIGGIVAFATYFGEAILISATVLRTDATIEINEKLNNKNM